ncbi:hypothetical protein CBR_g49706 [Chara braunii]|uniref:F-box domain-containing protein n=1 Tax=Chara braunii TaxID=69332 RepID=A0A388M5J7_CHABU|nr:hypothetical protein CBR_g49706 [Chara braunii]|eukprot:GBG89858.1 hypothetical protein CBR_g49706 [Chara braunii]
MAEERGLETQNPPHVFQSSNASLLRDCGTSFPQVMASFPHLSLGWSIPPLWSRPTGTEEGEVGGIDVGCVAVESVKERANDYISALPDEVALLVLSRVCDAKALVRCMAVSKRFQQLARQVDRIHVAFSRVTELKDFLCNNVRRFQRLHHLHVRKASKHQSDAQPPPPPNKSPSSCCFWAEVGASVDRLVIFSGSTTAIPQHVPSLSPQSWACRADKMMWCSRKSFSPPNPAKGCDSHRHSCVDDETIRRIRRMVLKVAGAVAGTWSWCQPIVKSLLSCQPNLKSLTLEQITEEQGLIHMDEERIAQFRSSLLKKTKEEFDRDHSLCEEDDYSVEDFNSLLADLLRGVLHIWGLPGCHITSAFPGPPLGGGEAAFIVLAATELDKKSGRGNSGAPTKIFEGIIQKMMENKAGWNDFT